MAEWIATLQPYEILSQLGEGGVGEVYRAQDSRLNREVAIKILLASFANDADRLRGSLSRKLAGVRHVFPHTHLVRGGSVMLQPTTNRMCVIVRFCTYPLREKWVSSTRRLRCRPQHQDPPLTRWVCAKIWSSS